MTYTSEIPPTSEILEGEWWPEDYNGPPVVSIATEVANAFDIGVGAELTLNIMGRDINATVANVRDIDWGSFAMNFAITFAPGTLESAPATYVTTVAMDKSAEMKAQTDIAKAFPNITTIRVRDALNLANSILEAIAQAVRYSAAVTLLAGVLVLAGAIAAGQKRRIYDAVVFKVLGIDRKQMMRVFLAEYFMLGLITALVACGIGTLCAWSIQTYVMEMGWRFSFMAVFSVAFGALVLSVLFGMIATWRILGVRPAPYLRNE
jgi:putative ABC transport system permease protein